MELRMGDVFAAAFPAGSIRSASRRIPVGNTTNLSPSAGFVSVLYPHRHTISSWLSRLTGLPIGPFYKDCPRTQTLHHTETGIILQSHKILREEGPTKTQQQGKLTKD